MSDLPLIRLDVPQTKLWWMPTKDGHLGLTATKQLIARVMGKRYGTCILLTDDLYAVAKTDSLGRLELASMPYRRYQMWQIFNQPELTQCHCANFLDPENQGPWGLRNSDRHHPMCVYDRPAMAVFQQFAGANRLIFDAQERGTQKDVATAVKEVQNIVQRQRPDAWVKARDELEGGNVSTLVNR